MIKQQYDRIKYIIGRVKVKVKEKEVEIVKDESGKI